MLPSPQPSDHSASSSHYSNGGISSSCSGTAAGQHLRIMMDERAAIDNNKMEDRSTTMVNYQLFSLFLSSRVIAGHGPLRF